MLPRAELELAISDWHGKRRTKKRGLQMRVAVAIVPGLLVAIVSAGWDEFVERGGQVALQTRLEFNRPQGGCATQIKDVGYSRTDARRVDDGSYFLGKVLHVSMASCNKKNLFLKGHRGILQQMSPVMRIQDRFTIVGKTIS